MAQPEQQPNARVDAGTKTVYLAGTMDTEWREAVRSAIISAGGRVWVPADNPQQSAALYVPADLKMAANADAVFAYIAPGVKARGTSAEMGVAFQAGKPIWLLWEDGSQIYSFLAVMAYKIFTAWPPAIDSICAFVKGGSL